MEKILEKFKDFTDGYRLILLLYRTENDGHDYDGFAGIIRAKISRNTSEFGEIVKEFLVEQKNNPGSRIYSCVNERNIDLVYYSVKHNIIKADYYDDDSRDEFYFDIGKNFLSIFMLHECRNESRYLIDVDFKDESIITDCETKLNSITDIVLKYETPNGWHFVTEEFNPELLKGYKIKYNAFLLISS